MRLHEGCVGASGSCQHAHVLVRSVAECSFAGCILPHSRPHHGLPMDIFLLITYALVAMLAQAGNSSAALAALSDQLVRAGYLPANGSSSSALQLQARPRHHLRNC